MKILPLSILLLLAAFGLRAEELTPVALAADPASFNPTGLGAEAMNFLLPLLWKYPKLVALCALMGALRIPMKLLFTWLEHQSATDGDHTAVDRIVSNPFYGLTRLLLDLFGSVKLDLIPPAASATAVALMLSLGFTGCTLGVQKGNIVSVTQSVIGIDIGQSADSNTPHVRLGYVRSQFHVVPTGTNIFAPAVLSSMSLDNTFSHQVIDEDFATGGATRDVKENSPAAASAKARTTKPATK